MCPLSKTSKRFFLPAASACQGGHVCGIWSAAGPVDDAANRIRLCTTFLRQDNEIQECPPNQAHTRVFPKQCSYKSVPQNRPKSLLHSRPGRPVQPNCCRGPKTIPVCVPIFYHIFPIKSASRKMRTRVFPNSRISYTRVFPKRLIFHMCKPLSRCTKCKLNTHNGAWGVGGGGRGR